MDRFTRTADIIKAYYSYKQTADSATFVKKVCSFFDFIKDERLSDADLNLLLFLANEAGIPQYYDLLKSKFTNAEIGDESINSLTMSALFQNYINPLMILLAIMVLFSCDIINLKSSQKNIQQLKADSNTSSTIFRLKSVQRVKRRRLPILFWR